MENKSISGKRITSLAHLPTWMLIFGYPIFWFELYYLESKTGSTTAMAWGLWISLCLLFVVRSKFSIMNFLKKNILVWKEQIFFNRLILFVGLFLCFFVLSVGLYVSFFPPHLVQEYDALNYHITLPRQHLMINSFKYIDWSVADLYFLPVDFALAPYWLSTSFPNKIPQFIFFLGLLGVSTKLVKYLGGKHSLGMYFIIFAICGSHIVGIQIGLAMIDMVLCYLFLATVDSFLSGRIVLGAIEFSFYFWAKSFLPIQMILIAFLMVFCFFILKRFGFNGVTWGFQESIDRNALVKVKEKLRKFILFFIFFSFFIGGPFVVKSLKVTGTPIFPFFPGIIDLGNINRDSVWWSSVEKKAQEVRNTKDQYGGGRSVQQFVKHLWLIAVPEKGVNNRYDYPVGLTYLIFVGPFLWLLYGSLKNRQAPIIPLFIIFYWAVWWVGSQQTRFLFVPLLLMYISVVAEEKISGRIFFGMIIFSLFLTSVSFFRTHRPDFGKSRYEMLRSKDKELLKMANTVKNYPVVLDYPDVAYASFPVEVKNSDSIFVLKY